MSRSSTSPFRGTVGRSNNTNGSSESLELLIRSLERENNSLVEEINILKSKNKKVGDLEEKIDLVLKHNTQLLSENEKLAKLINQKKSEIEVWKSKYDTMSVNKSASSELENRRLLNEIEKLKEEITDIEHVKNMQISEIKNEHHMEIQSVKRAHLNNNEKYELEIRKLKEYCEKKEYEISDLNMKFVRLNKETDFEIGKLREEKERLRSDLSYEEMEHRKEVEGLKSKFDYNFHSEVENLKKQHLNQVEALDYENAKLKEVIGSKNLEIDSILAKNQKVKHNAEDSMNLLKRENEDLRDKMIEAEHINELELNNLKEKLDGMRESELHLLRSAHQNQLDLLNREVAKLQEIITDRNAEMEQLAMERNQMRNDKETEILNCRAELEAQINVNRDLTARYEDKLKACDYDYKCKEEELETLRNYLQTQIDTLRAERDNINDLLEKKADELARTRADTAKEIRTLREEAHGLRNEILNLKDDLERETKKGNSEADDLRRTAELKEKQLKTKISALNEQIDEKDSIIKELQASLETKEEEIQASNLKIEMLELAEKELRRELRENTVRWDAKEQQLNALIKNQIEEMERNRKRQIEELGSIHDNKTRTMKHQIAERDREIDDKNKSLNGLKDKYEALVNKFEEVFSQRAAQKQLDIKVPGWLPNTMATKDLFDVFLKTKVLEYCS